MLNHDRTNSMQMKAQTSLLRIFSASCTAEKVSSGFLIGGRCFGCFEPGETSLKRAKNSLGTRTRRQCCTCSPIVKAIVGRAEIMQQQKKKRAVCSAYATPLAFQPCRRWTLTLFISCVNHNTCRVTTLIYQVTVIYKTLYTIQIVSK